MYTRTNTVVRESEPSNSHILRRSLRRERRRLWLLLCIVCMFERPMWRYQVSKVQYEGRCRSNPIREPPKSKYRGLCMMLYTYIVCTACNVYKSTKYQSLHHSLNFHGAHETSEVDLHLGNWRDVPRRKISKCKGTSYVGEIIWLSNVLPSSSIFFWYWYAHHIPISCGCSSGVRTSARLRQS